MVLKPLSVIVLDMLPLGCDFCQVSQPPSEWVLRRSPSEWAKGNGVVAGRGPGQCGKWARWDCSGWKGGKPMFVFCCADPEVRDLFPGFSLDAGEQTAPGRRS